MQPAVRGLAAGDQQGGKGVPCEGACIQVTVGSKSKPRVARAEGWSARTDRERERPELPRLAPIERNSGDNALDEPTHPRGDDVLRIDWIHGHVGFGSIMDGPGTTWT